MKKRLIAMLMGLCMIAIATGCGPKYEIGENGEVYNKYIQVNKWKGLEIQRIEAVEVTDADIEAGIMTDMQSEWKKVGITDRAAAEGDTVIIDYVGKIDGKKFDGGSRKNAPLILGANMFIDGFEEGIIGKNPGETFNLDLVFPKSYDNTELAGKAVVFTVTLNAILPEFSEELVPKLSSTATTVEEYREEIKQEIAVSNQETAEADMRSQLLSILCAQCEIIKYPEKQLKKYTAYYTQLFETEFEALVKETYNMTVEEFETEYGMTAEDMVKSYYGVTYTEMAQGQILLELAVELVAEVEGISHTEDEYQEFLKEQAELSALESGEDFEKTYDETYGEGACRYYFLEDKVSYFLYDNCVIVEPTETTE